MSTEAGHDSVTVPEEGSPAPDVPQLPIGPAARAHDSVRVAPRAEKRSRNLPVDRASLRCSAPRTREVCLYGVLSLLLWLSACGDPLFDRPTVGLIDDTGYSTSYSSPEELTDPYVSVRWFAGEEQGTHVPCDGAPAEVRNATEIPVIARRPDASLLEPPAWAELDGARYAIGMLVLSDGPYAGRSSADEPLGGVWGFDDSRVLVEIEGAPSVVEKALEIERGSLVDGPNWLFVAPKPPLTNGWEQVLTTTAFYAYGSDTDDALVVYPTSEAYFHMLRLAAGLGPGGITFEACP